MIPFSVRRSSSVLAIFSLALVGLSSVFYVFYSSTSESSSSEALQCSSARVSFVSTQAKVFIAGDTVTDTPFPIPASKKS